MNISGNGRSLQEWKQQREATILPDGALCPGVVDVRGTGLEMPECKLRHTVCDGVLRRPCATFRIKWAALSGKPLNG